MGIARHWRLAMRRPTARSSSDAARKDRVKRIVATVSRGNIRLQRGEYVTQEELAKQYERVKTLDFGSE